MKMLLEKLFFGLIAAFATVFRLSYRPVSATVGGVPPVTPFIVTLRPFAYGAEDSTLKKTVALPAAPGTVDTGILDLYKDASGWQEGDQYEMQLRVGALTTTELPDAATITFHLMESDNADGSSPVEAVATSAMTGAGGVGSKAQAGDFRPPLRMKQYVFGRFVCVGTGNLTTNAQLGTLALKF